MNNNNGMYTHNQWHNVTNNKEQWSPWAITMQNTLQNNEQQTKTTMNNDYNEYTIQMNNNAQCTTMTITDACQCAWYTMKNELQ